MADNLSRALKDTTVRNAKPADKPYKLTDGGGLFLLVQPNGARLWRYKFRLHGKEGVFAIGAYPDVKLADARKAHLEARAQVAAGVSPVASRKAERAEAVRQALLADKGAFDTVLSEWKGEHHKTLAESTVRQQNREIAKYIEPEFSGKQVSAITRVEISTLVKRVAKKAPEVARNLRTYLYAIFEHAIDLGLLDANPVPPPRVIEKRDKQRHHQMLPADALPAFLVALDNSLIRLGTRVAMMLVILTACRKNEAAGARWEEFDLAAGEWRIPKDRMKARLEHVVPLSTQAVGLLQQLHELRTQNEFLFPHRSKPGTPMADRTLNAVVERLGYGDLATPHGFRSLFSTHWNGKKKSPDVIERCLAHAPGNKVRAAYNRYEYFDERRALLQEWADYIDEQRTRGLQESSQALKEAA